MDQDVRGGEETAWRGRLATLSRAEFIEKLAEADIGPDEPLHPILVMNYETSMMAWEAVKVGARGLSPEGERELIHMVAENAIGVTGQAVERLIRKATFRNSLSIALAALAILAAGFLWGDWNAPGRGSFLGSVRDGERCRLHAKILRGAHVSAGRQDGLPVATGLDQGDAVGFCCNGCI